jgi:hypothetical protein
VVDLLAELIEHRVPTLGHGSGAAALLFVEALVEGHT